MPPCSDQQSSQASSEGQAPIGSAEPDDFGNGASRRIIPFPKSARSSQGPASAPSKDLTGLHGSIGSAFRVPDRFQRVRGTLASHRLAGRPAVPSGPARAQVCLSVFPRGPGGTSKHPRCPNVMPAIAEQQDWRACGKRGSRGKPTKFCVDPDFWANFLHPMAFPAHFLHRNRGNLRLSRRHAWRAWDLSSRLCNRFHSRRRRFRFRL